MIKINIHKALHGVNGEMSLDVNLNIKKGEFVALTGASGSGKTTLLRILAGLEEIEGKIELNTSHKHAIGFMHQNEALFPNMTVMQNLLFIAKDKELAIHLLTLTNLLKLQERYPNTLSGGQKQRVSLCRVMMQRPEILLLDEPLSALDAKMRTKLQIDILKLHKEFKTTTIMVSHDPSEIYKLSTRTLTLENGKIIKDGNTKEVLLKTQGSQKFSFEGELLELKEVDVVVIAIVAIGQQIVEIVLSKEEAKNLKVGTNVTLSTKSFSPSVH